MFAEATKESPKPGWRARECHPYKITTIHTPKILEMRDFDGNEAKDISINGAEDLRSGLPVDLVNIKGRLFIWRDNLFLSHTLRMSCGCKSDGLQNRGSCTVHREAQPLLLMRKLRAMLPDYPDEEAARNTDYLKMLYDLGMAMPFIKTMTVIECIQISLTTEEQIGLPTGAPNLSILDSLCCPASQRGSGDGAFACAGEEDVASPFNGRRDVELRPEQEDVINALKHRLELIQGPPGTGKTTIIRAILRARIPHGTSKQSLFDWLEPKLPIRDYCATQEERTRSSYPDNSSLEGEGWVTTAGRRVRVVSGRGEGEDPDRQHLLALDCEMVETASGSALARVSVVGPDGECLYDSYVKPPEEVTDYRTNFSGISSKTLEGVDVTLTQVQGNLLQMITEESILIGHSLENDLVALKLVHECVVDTALIFPHPCGWPHRHSLAKLCNSLLKRGMSRFGGHDSIVDAQTALELAKLKFDNGHKFGETVGMPVTLLLAVQNKAIDVLVSGFEPFVDSDAANSRMGMLVVGSATNPNMGAAAAAHTLDELLLHNQEYKGELAKYEHLVRLRRWDEAHNQEELLQELRQRVTENIVSGVRLVFSTTSELFKILRSPLLREHICHRITSVIIDEAGTMPETSTPLIATLPAVKRIICVGDVQQLPPFSHVQARVRPDGFMARVQAQLKPQDGNCIRLLRRQFRMSRYICNFVSDAFYDGQLIMDAIEGSLRAPEFVPGGRLRLSGIYWLDYSASAPTHIIQKVDYGEGRGTRLEITRIRRNRHHNCIHGRCEEDVFNSKANATEIHHIICCLCEFVEQHFLDAGPQGKSIAVICFYKQQSDVLEASLDALESRRLRKILQESRERGALRIRTVDSFQGNEADIVILSGVRSNENQEVGFLASTDGQKRICVATSRAKEALIIIGDHKTLACGKLAFSKLWSECHRSKYQVAKVHSSADLMQPARAAAAQQMIANQISDLFS